MPSFVVVAGDMADLEAGSGISARIDLNLHLAPPTSADFLRLGPGPVDEEGRAGQELSQRRILPRFGPGIHGVFLDLHQESESSEGSRNRASVSATVVHGGEHEESTPQQQQQPQHSQQRLYHAASSNGDAIGESLVEPAMMRPPMRIRRYPRPASVVRIGGGSSSRRRVDVTAIRSHHQVLDRGSKDKDPVDESKESVKAAGGSDNFECNVCLDLAVEPVVTVCGHLFCWHCLYQWLYVHSDNEECPVCKGSVGEGSIIPIYGRGTSAVALAAAAPAPAPAPEEGREAVPPRPQARRVDSLRQRLEEAEWDRLNPEEGEREGRRAFWHLNEVLRMRRAIRFLQDSMPSRSRVLRRRMSERREHYRTSFPPPPTAQQSSSDSFEQDLAGPGGRGATYLQDDYFRELAASRAETEDRVAVIRARLANLVDTIENHRRHAASMVATMHHHDPVTLLVTQQPATRAGTSSSSRRAGVTTTAAAAVAAAATTVSTSTSTPQPRTSSTVVEGPSAAAAAAGPSGSGSEADLGETAEASGDVGDVDPEVLRSRKRRRLI